MRRRGAWRTGRWRVAGGRGLFLDRLGYFLCILLAMPVIAHAQESPAQWIARIFDSATLGIAPYPGAALNRKLSVDAIALERGGNKRIAIFIIPPDQLKPAADHFAKQLGVAPQITGADSPFVTYTFDLTDAATAPAKFAGLRLLVSRSQFVDNKGQITMEYTPKPK